MSSEQPMKNGVLNKCRWDSGALQCSASLLNLDFTLASSPLVTYLRSDIPHRYHQIPIV